MPEGCLCTLPTFRLPERARWPSTCRLLAGMLARLLGRGSALNSHLSTYRKGRDGRKGLHQRKSMLTRERSCMNNAGAQGEGAALGLARLVQLARSVG